MKAMWATDIFVVLWELVNTGFRRLEHRILVGFKNVLNLLEPV